MHNFHDRRHRLLATLPDESSVLLFSGVFHKRSADSLFPFAVNTNFYYLTGIKQENSALLITKREGKISETLFILKYNKAKEMWDGKKLTPSEAAMISAINNVAERETLDEVLSTLLLHTPTLFLDLEPAVFVDEMTTTSDLAASLSTKYKVKINDIYPAVIKMRMIKDDYEIALIKESIALTHEAINVAREQVKPHNHEYEVAASFAYALARKQGKLGFETIIASGKNATILHYIELNDKLHAGDLVLFDLGGHNNMYTADISRTYPISGSFTKLQAQIYETVLACNKAVINYIKPGLTLLNLQEFAKTFMKKELVRLKLMSEADDLARYYYHGVSHHLGLDTHDPSDRTLPLAAGNVITVEPGLYFSEYGIGVRIEDNILVTKNGATNLSRAIPKEIKDIT